MKTILTSDCAPKPAGPYSVAVKTGNLIFVSGQIAPDATGDNPVSTQTERILSNLKILVESYGLTLGHVVKTTIFLTDINQFDTMNSIYSKYFRSNPPARSCVEVSRLPKGALVEVEVILSAE
ncbi:MAG: reactive intermediate/imine deaminase [Candidatus Auribacter fodinae]|jgi:2-iminobutanoate/2-iminopropanoate deaminase|uniref:Reactive intermediate/imine deaminase n=1 Tax=Candidatus Auribacter fodinae TaxID=2093366 RepID=A0A3A4QYK1_9BACT|nr:MAG: reactive intermediate/imine deaminase [Candidatus Auribacter fodinae]